MLLLLAGVAIGIVLIALIAAGGVRAIALIVAGAALLLVVFGAVVLLPPHQFVCLATSARGSPAPRAGVVLGGLAGCAALGGLALGLALNDGAGWAAALNGPGRQTTLRIVRDLAILGGCVVACLAAAGGVGVLAALAVGWFAGLAVVAALELRGALADAGPTLRANWGGLGGGIGGWEMSRSFVLALAVVVFTAAALLAVVLAPAPAAPLPDPWRLPSSC